MSATELAKELANIHHFHSDHYALCLPPKFCKIIFYYKSFFHYYFLLINCDG